MLDTDLETICWLIVKMREFEVEDAMPIEPADDDESVAPDAPADSEEMAEEVADPASGYFARVQADPIFDDVKRIIDDLNEDAQIELVALAWMGRGDYSGVQDWPEAVREARARRNAHTAEYLLGMPMASEYLEQGLEQIGLTCSGTEAWSL
jgi:hypothetical protein